MSSMPDQAVSDFISHFCMYVIYHKRIKNLRIDNDISQPTIADYIGIDRVSYSRLENEHFSIKFDCIIKVAKLYNVSIDYLAGLTDIPSKLNEK